MAIQVCEIDFSIAKCIHPLHLSWTSVHDSNIDNFLVVAGYTDPAVEGSSINLTCSSGVITGPTMVTCMQNGECEPHPTNVICEGKH